MNKAIFLDLDGTLIKTKSGKNFPINSDDWEFISGILPIIRSYSDKGYIPIIVSNQGGIEAGHIDPILFDEKFDRVRNEIAEYIGSAVNGSYCPFLDKNNYYRKPNPGMAYNMALKLTLSLRDSIMVGSDESDRKFARNAYIGIYYDVESFIKDHNV